MIKKVEGIIINSRDYSESSRIIDVLTKEYGTISVLAKGAKKIKNGMYAYTSKLNLCSFNINYKDKGLSSLISADAINPFLNIKKDIKKISFASFLTDLINQIIKKEINYAIYNIYIETLNKIDEGYDPEVLISIVQIKMLEFLGIKPVLDNCVICHDCYDVITISSEKGGYLCQKCVQGDKIFSDKMLKIVKMFYYVDISKITKLEISAEVKKELNDFIDDYYEQHAGLYLKSKLFLKNLEKIK